MSFDLNELRAQRDKIREHLAWLDRQIARAEVAQESGAPKPAAPQAEAKATKPSQPVSTANSAPATPIPLSEATAIPMDFSPKDFGSSSKFGCIAAAFTVAGIIIFLLFGLPYLIPPTEFEQANLDMVAAMDVRIGELNTDDGKRALRAEIQEELMKQRDRLQDYLKAEEGLSKEAQSTKKTINDLEALLDKLR